MAIPRQSDRSFGVSFAAFFTVIFAVAWLLFNTRLYWMLAGAGSFLALALLCPGILMPLNRLWGVLAGKLGVVNNFVLLGAFYYVVILPTGVVLRLVGWDPMKRRAFGNSDSSWSPVTREVTDETYRDPF